ncbi:MAG: hypothetical protein MUE84_11330 [Hyphomonas sp.]|jgi:hypothetical protein|nr:hypothetical protein [Hyphomonas sp.]
MTLRGKRNIYTCEKCGSHVVTWDRDEGVTPFLIRCEAIGCGSMMQSSMYRVFDQRMRPAKEWYRPTAIEAATMDAGMQDHIARGGLALRAFSGPNPPPWMPPEQQDAASGKVAL